MASLIVDQGLQASLDATFDVGGGGSGDNFDPVDAIGVSDHGDLASGDTDLANATNDAVNALDDPSSRTDQTVTAEATFGTGEANFEITTVSLHMDGADATTGLYGGVDAQSLTKTSDFSLTITMDVTYSSA